MILERNLWWIDSDNWDFALNMYLQGDDGPKFNAPLDNPNFSNQNKV